MEFKNAFMHGLFRFLLCVSIISVGYTCPPADLIKPCVCRYDSEVYCVGLYSHEILEDIFLKNPYMSFDKLTVEDSSMLYVPKSIFENAKFVRFQVSRSSFVSIFDGPATSRSVNSVEIENSVFQRGVQWDLFSKLNLTWLGIYDTTVRKLPKDFGDRVPASLQGLALFNTNLVHIHPDALVKLRNMISLGISQTNFKIRQKIKFPKIIDNISFSHSQMESLPDGFFNDLPYLKSVWLGKNNFTTIRQELFSVPAFLDMSDNPIRCNCLVKWIVETEISKRPWKIDGQCVSPERVKGKDIRSLTSDDFSDYC